MYVFWLQKIPINKINITVNYTYSSGPCFTSFILYMFFVWLQSLSRVTNELTSF